MHPNEIDKQREPAIWFRRQPGKASLSKLGGLPSLPSKIEWPRQRQTGTPLHFLVQVDLSQMPPTPLDGGANAPKLPGTGLLFFFADMVEEMLWNENGGPFATTRVIFTNRAGPQRPVPDDIPEILHGFGQRAGGYQTGMSAYPEAALEPHVIDTFGGVNPHADTRDTYSAAAQAAMVASIERAIGPLPLFKGPGSWDAIKAANPREYIEETRFQNGVVRRKLHCPLHQMLGIGKDIQGTAESAHADGTVLLLQMDSDTLVHKHFMFCDMGVAQFWIEPADLAEEGFDRAWGTTEGG
ncbi:protein of unknown function [Bradyrhizobium lablabi]|uniref:DUF1963 domain-containing protein n=1 Tax=Bradyrhizobium lablabi TaxID=722472 RepID=A0A1M6TVU5_9BRAD|nr:YwqG family protein [Bradyrhizobium lablabi]SHK61056.1 protein of unknown function [Bradyrhizobium lablabi]